ncbi:hypothetical protein MOBT1_000682 [Malassezia obtusa]|uniref:Uncharacterized protein n=1 Tax=Malassezia obtusa TaxID=76774 RepID=A0AAF0ISB2_9BASI|nr:hypothetical protein MOBT1_000682 [Malassezia obtusa]
MFATVRRSLRIRALPANLRIHEAVARQAAETAQRAAPAPPAPSVVERLSARDLPGNVRLVPYVSRKNRFWKVRLARLTQVSKQQRDTLRAELKET